MSTPKIEVIHRVIEGDPDVSIWRVRIKNNNGIWTEGFGSMELLNAFLKGVQAAFSFTDVGYVDVSRHLKPS